MTEEDMIEDKQTKELERQYALLEQLSYYEPFQLWRDQVATPVLGQINAQLASPMEMTEANLKATVMYKNLVEGLFTRIFQDIKLQKEFNKSEE